MTNLASVARIVSYSARGLGALQILMGLGIWTGLATGIVPIHILMGLLITLLLLAAAVVGIRAKEPTVKVVVGFAWAPLLIWLGLNQATLLVGDSHWIVQTLHLLVGLAALGLVEALTRQARASPRSAEKKNAASM